jgi:hypothetical protein
MLLDLFILVLFALVLSNLMTWGFRWRHPARSDAVGSSILFLFLVLTFAMWAGMVWLPPSETGRTPWLSLILIGVVLSLLFLATAVPGRTPHTAAESLRQERDAAAAGTAFGLFFWLLLVVLTGATAAGYLLH